MRAFERLFERAAASVHRADLGQHGVEEMPGLGDGSRAGRRAVGHRAAAADEGFRAKRRDLVQRASGPLAVERVPGVQRGLRLHQVTGEQDPRPGSHATMSPSVCPRPQYCSTRSPRPPPRSIVNRSVNVAVGQVSPGIESGSLKSLGIRPYSDSQSCRPRSAISSLVFSCVTMISAPNALAPSTRTAW